MTRILDPNGREIVTGSVVRYEDAEYEVWRVGADGTLGLNPGSWSTDKPLRFFTRNIHMLTVPVADVVVTGWNDPSQQYSRRY